MSLSIVLLHTVKNNNHSWNSAFTSRHLINTRDADYTEGVQRKQINEQDAGGIYLGKRLKELKIPKLAKEWQRRNSLLVRRFE